jgi:hypothetical protein
METVRLKSWSSFMRRIKAIYDECQKLRKDGVSYVSEPVFRGQANARWPLQTTLEREVGRDIGLVHYYNRILHPALRLLKGVLTVDLPDLPKNLGSLKIRDIDVALPLYEQLAMLRHHGFPSPLLDWTHSPYVAAYFAFSQIPSNPRDNVAIFAYREYLGGPKGYRGDRAHIKACGRWASVHSRHIRQQSMYTIALRNDSGTVRFCDYESAVRERPFEFLRYDEIVKFEIPASEREHALRDLRLMNVTEFSLFDTTDALVKTVAQLALTD